ncbi:MAG TPA: ABC transporter permease [Candidatus Acidoferrum sp.]|jgi:putative ABC transport system permease protein|nr:ABC transporter permease [Candidatus Acidoferrum sp.]
MRLERWIYTIPLRFRSLFRRNRVEQELDEELRYHLERKTEEFLAQGVSPEDARRRAFGAMDGLELRKEECRDARGVNFLDTLSQDVRFGLRLLRKSPGFTAVAVLTIALGIGANTAIFGLVDTAFLRGLPFLEPGRLVHIWTIEEDGDTHTPTPMQYQAIREDSKLYEQIAAGGWADYLYSADSSVTQNLAGFLVTANWFPALGVQPLLGRNFREQEQRAGQDGVVILSYDCWRTRFHADPSVIGRQIVLNRRLATIVGVLAQSLGPYFDELEIFAPLVPDSYASQGNVRAGKMRVQIIARLKPGVTLGQARLEAEVIASRFKNPDARADQSKRFVVEDFAEMFRNPGPTRRNAQRGLWMTAVASGVVLLIACSNVASLLLARGVKRHREIAVRSALGCSRSRMIRQLLTESTLLFLCGGIIAVVVTRWCEEIITKTASGMFPGVYLQVDMRVFTISLAVSFLSALAFGMIPALQASRVSLTENLKDAARNAVLGAHSRRPRKFLVAAQVALGMVLLVGFGLLLRSFLQVEFSRLGYDPRNVLTATIRLPLTRYTAAPDRARLMRNAEERMRFVPGVESVGMVDSLPMEGADASPLKIESPVANTPPVEDEIWFVCVGPDYFSTLRVPMLSGRAFRETDGQGASPVAIVNQTFARQFFPGTNPIGYHLAFRDSPMIWREIVGVVSDFRQRNPEEDLRALAYFPVAQTTPPRWSLAIRVRAARDLANVASRISGLLQAVDPQLYWELGSMQAQIHDSESLTLRRPVVTLLASFGALSLVLVVVGVFGVTSYSVAERTREIGIRTALGADRLKIAGLVLRESLGVTSAGLLVGTFCAFAAARFLPTEGIGWSGSGIFLYGVSRTDSLTYGLAAALLASVVLAASWLPARRAMRVDPMVALRDE